jgi:glycosyltransferase involved in cell wall biosynthesis
MRIGINLLYLLPGIFGGKENYAAFLPEIGGERALYFNPESVESIVQTIGLALSDDNLRQQLIAKWNENLKKYSWKKTSKETVLIYKIIFNEHWKKRLL